MLFIETECDYLNNWIQKRSHMQKSHLKMVSSRDIVGNAEEEDLLNQGK